MTNSSILESSASSRFGWPKPKRIEELKKLSSSASEATHRLDFLGQNKDIPIVRVQIDLPKYRLANGRTVSLQEEYLAQNPEANQDMFSGDPELWEAQEVQHDLLLKVVKKANLQKYFANTSKKQTEPILLDENGFVVNGNRRLACWRDLLHKEPEKYGHFRHIDVTVLPHCDEKDIDRIEANLQIEEDIKADYSWDAKASMILAKMKRDEFSTNEIANLYNMKKGKVDEMLSMREVASEYLQSRDKANRWSFVSEDEYAFRQIVIHMGKISDVGKKEIFKAAAFLLIDKPEGMGRLYDAIPDIAENLPKIKEKLFQRFNINLPVSDERSDNILGDAPPGSETCDLPLAQEIQKLENGDEARKIILEVNESCRQIERDSRNANFLLDCCSDAHASLDTAVKNGLRPESEREGVSKQLEAISDQVKRIQKYLGEHE